MESPVRICLGAAFVVNVLLISSTIADSTTLTSTSPVSIKYEKPTRFLRVNNTLGTRNKTKNFDTALNELSNKDLISEEYTEKNAKYKDRGRVKFHSQIKANVENVTKKISTTSDAVNLIIVTPTPEVKKPAEIIDSMREFKKTKMPTTVSSTSTSAPVTVNSDLKEEEDEEYEDEEEDDDNEFHKFSTNKFHENDFFTIPGYGENDHNFNPDSEQESSHNKHDYSSSPFDGFSSYFTDHEPYKDEEPYKSDSFFEFGSELTTPKNDFFDKKYQQITSSIMKRLRSITKTSPQDNSTNVHTIVEEKLSNGIGGIPSNKSTVIIKNTKEIRLLDNDEAGTSNKALSDVHGTSIYYEMSVLSTETYAINQDEDCDNDTLNFEPTISTSLEEELAALRSTEPTLLPFMNKSTIYSDSREDFLSTLSSRFSPFKNSVPNIYKASTPVTGFNRELSLTTLRPPELPVSTETTIDRGFSTTEPTIYPLISLDSISSSVVSIFNPNSTVAISTQNTVFSTEKYDQATTTSTSRSRNYSKRLNFRNNKDTINSIAPKSEQPPSIQQTPRKFHYTTPKAKRVWMAPVRSVPRTSYTRSTAPTTIYSEHFNVKDKLRAAAKTKQSNRTSLTTVTSEIDPVLQSDLGSTKKIVYSQPIFENTIPLVRKRGSSKFTTSTANSAETESVVSEMEIPPTLTAWALASLISPPSLTVNSTVSTHKSVDENELQKVGESIDQKEVTTSSMSSMTTPSTITNDFASKKITEMFQNKIHWKPVKNSLTHSETQFTQNPTESKSERLPAESNISVQSSAESVTTTETMQIEPTETVGIRISEKSWIPVTEEMELNLRDLQSHNRSDRIPPVDGTKSTGFESITKLPSGMTTPQDDTVVSTEVKNLIISEVNTKVPTTTDYQITTVRFKYLPTQVTENFKTEKTVNLWRPILPTRTKMPIARLPTTIKIPTTETVPVTTYRPKYVLNTVDTFEETTTILPELTSQDKVPSRIETSEPESLPEATEILEQPTTTTISTDTKVLDHPMTTTTSTTTSTTTTDTSLSTVTSETTTSKSTTSTIRTTTSKPSTTSVSTSTGFGTTTILTNENVTNTQFTEAEVDSVETTTDIEEITTRVVVEVVTEINTEKERFEILTTTATSSDKMAKTPSNVTQYNSQSEENSGSNEVIVHDTPKITTSITTKEPINNNASTQIPYTDGKIETTQDTIIETTEPVKESPTQMNANILDNSTFTENSSIADEYTTTDITTRSISDLEDLTNYAGDMTTESSSRVSSAEETGSGAAVAIAVSTIGVIALILLIGLLLVVRRRGRRGVYAQRCTPVSLDAYSLDSVSVGPGARKRPRLRASKRSYGNPAYDDEVTSHPMQYAALANFALDIDSMITEYSEIPSVTVQPEEVPPGCEDKNRYSNVLPLPETRVPLSRIGNDPTTEYINANYITGPGNIRNYYIACQAPLPNTVVDFWRMVWEQNSRVIVMLTEYMENGVEKCYEYLPPSEISDNKRTFAEYQIILKKREQKDKYAVSTIQLINLNTRTWREVTHLWYFWPAKGVPDDYDSVIDFLSEMRSYMKISQTAKEYDEEGVEVIYGDQSRASYGNLSKLRGDDIGSGNGVNVYSPARAEELMRRNHATNGTLTRMKAASELEAVRPCTVVCASGAGRSAALIALDVCARALAAGAADVPRVVRELRAQRPHAISNKHHYIFLYKVLSEYGNKLMGIGVDTI